MKVSIIVPCLNEESNILSCLNSLINQTYPKDRYEIIIVDGGSKDKTEEIVCNIRKDKLSSEIRFITELKKGTASGRNRGIKEARFDYIAFVDADCVAPLDWLEILVAGYKKASKNNSLIVGVGGGNIPPKNTDNFVKAIGIALDSYAGSFGSIQGRRLQKDSYVQSIATLNALYEKSKLEEIGLYDESLGSEAEDAELNYRLIKAGYRLFYIKDSFVWHNMRPTPKTWFKNMFRYGKGRARLLKRYPEMWRFQYLLPLLFILSLVCLFSSLCLPFFGKGFWLIGLYFPTVFIYSLFQCLKQKESSLLSLIPNVALVYFIQHLGYGVGEFYGLLNRRVS